MKEKLIKELNEIYKSYTEQLKISMENSSVINKQAVYKLIFDGNSKSLVRKSHEYGLVNDKEIEIHIAELYQELKHLYSQLSQS